MTNLNDANYYTMVARITSYISDIITVVIFSTKILYDYAILLSIIPIL